MRNFTYRDATGKLKTIRATGMLHAKTKLAKKFRLKKVDINKADNIMRLANKSFKKLKRKVIRK